MSSLLLKNCILCNSVNPESVATDILVKDGKFSRIEAGIPVEEGMEVIDVAGKFVYPGFVDAHCHTGLSDFAVEHTDYNEHNDPLTPHLRAIDAFNPLDESIKRTALGGITTFATGPGSANVLGGTFMAIKPLPGGVCVDKMVINPAIAMKAAFGENPRRCYRTTSISSRMTTAAKLREILFKALEYANKLDKAKNGADRECGTAVSDYPPRSCQGRSRAFPRPRPSAVLPLRFFYLCAGSHKAYIRPKSAPVNRRSRG